MLPGGGALVKKDFPFFVDRSSPRGLQEGFRGIQDSSKRPPKRPPRRSPQEAPRWPQEDASKRPPGGSQAAPRGTPEAPKTPQSPPGTPRRPQDAPGGIQEAGWAQQDLVPHDCGMTWGVLPQAFGPSSSFERFGCPPPFCCFYNTSLITSTRLGVLSGWAGGDTRSVNYRGAALIIATNRANPLAFFTDLSIMQWHCSKQFNLISRQSV